MNIYLNHLYISSEHYNNQYQLWISSVLHERSPLDQRKINYTKACTYDQFLLNCLATFQKWCRCSQSHLSWSLIFWIGWMFLCQQFFQSAKTLHQKQGLNKPKPIQGLSIIKLSVWTMEMNTSDYVTTWQTCESYNFQSDIHLLMLHDQNKFWSWCIRA